MRPTALDSFCADCGLTAPLELEVAVPGQGPSRHAIAQPFALLGRSPEATLCLDDDAVSQRHAYLQVVRGRAFVLDLESRSRLRLDDQPSSAGWLLPGQSLGLGPFELTLRGGAAGPPPPEWGNPLEDEVFGPERAGLASFDIFVGERMQAKWRMNRSLALIGRSSRCRVRLPDPSVSRIHCAVVATARGVWLVDLLSREGTRVRGEPVQFTRLEEGERVEVGIYRLRVRYHHLGVHGPATAPRAEVTPALTRAVPPAPVVSPPVMVMGESPGALVPSPPEGGLVAADSPVLGALVQQFSLMQQHMFDQFQQTLVMMAQMMSSIHQEHAALIREEMRQFQRATEELQELKRQLSQAPPAPVPPPATPAAAEPAPAASAPVAASPPATPASAQAPPAQTPPAAIPGPAPPASGSAPVPAPASKPAAPPAATPGRAEAPRTPGFPPLRPTAAPAPAPSVDDGLGPMISITAPTAAQAENAPGPVEEDSDAVHAWLTGRIAELESERQSRWQKILGFLRGG